MRPLAWLGAMALSACMLAHDAIAQDPGVTRAGIDSLRAASGARIRVKDTGADGWQTGTLGGVSNGMLVLEGKNERRIALSTLERVQRSMGKRRLDGAVIGFPFGLAAGGAIGWIVGHNQRKSDEPHGSQPAVGLVIGAALGAGIAALIGAETAPERWKDIKIR